MDEKFEAFTVPIEIIPGKSLIINAKLSQDQQNQLVCVLQAQSKAFSWTYMDMRGIHIDTCIHHIYTQENIRPMKQP